MARILVRVKQGRRMREDGATWVGGQTLWIEDGRFSDLSDMVDQVMGVEPQVFTGAMAEPGPVMQPDVAKPMGVVNTELSKPRDPQADIFPEPKNGFPVPVIEEEAPIVTSSTDDDDSAEFAKVPERKKTPAVTTRKVKKGK